MENTPTLRDQFAMAALTGRLASNIDETPENSVRWAYNYADAMLLERDKKKD